MRARDQESGARSKSNVSSTEYRYHISLSAVSALITICIFIHSTLQARFIIYLSNKYQARATYPLKNKILVHPEERDMMESIKNADDI